MAPTYEVVDNYFIDVTLNDKGDVVKKNRLVKGDTVEKSEEDAERLVRAGALRLPSDDDEEQVAPVDPGTLAYQGGVTGGAGDATTRTTTAPLDGTGAPLNDDDPKVDGSDDGGDVEDEYTDMSKPDLQAKAEARGLAKSGNVKELQARLRDYDEAQRS